MSPLVHGRRGERVEIEGGEIGKGVMLYVVLDGKRGENEGGARVEVG